MSISENKFLGMIVIFIFGFLNIIPNKISIYDQYLIPLIQNNIAPGGLFYAHITFLIIFFRILIIVGTLFEGYKALKYGIRWNVFGLDDLITKIHDYVS